MEDAARALGLLGHPEDVDPGQRPLTFSEELTRDKDRNRACRDEGVGEAKP
jgi:hypothetical protein